VTTATPDTNSRNNTSIYYPKWGYGIITGRVWADANRNGIQDAGERGIPNALVYIDREMPRRTDALGNYVLDLSPGTTRVAVQLEGQGTFTKPNAGSDDTRDSDVVVDPTDPSRASTPQFNLRQGQTVTVDSGVVPAA
jgi:hypothetical protein